MAAHADDDDPWAITEAPIPVPDAVVGSDPVVALRRLMASRGELENRRRDETRAAAKTLEKLLTDVLGVADALDRALAAASEGDDDARNSSVASIRRRVARVLRRQGVEQVEQVGKPVDPEISDVEDVEIDPDSPPETVLRESIAAYTWQGLVLRRGSVIVSVRSSTPES